MIRDVSMATQNSTFIAQHDKYCPPVTSSDRANSSTLHPEMPSITDLLYLPTPVLIKGLEGIVIEMREFLEVHREMITYRDGCLTTTDYANIPRYMGKATHLLGTMRAIRCVITLRYDEMTDDEIIKIDDRMILIKAQEVRLHLISSWFQHRMAIGIEVIRLDSLGSMN